MSISVIVLYCVLFASGVLAGALAILSSLKLTTKKGYLLIDESNPDKPIWRIDLNNLLDDNTRKFVLEIKRGADLSHK